MSTIEIAIRSIQHYMYCPHRWGLLEIDRAWAENFFVTKANLLHERVHNPDNHYNTKGKKIFTSVPVYHDLDPYNLYGIIDCIEMTESDQGIVIDKNNKRYKLCIIEYKPTKPKNFDFREEDAMQVFAQKICVDYVFKCNCDAVIYYGDVKRRIPLPLNENYQTYDRYLKQLLFEMRENLKTGKIPPISKKQNCNGCSMRDLCMPSFKKTRSLRAEIEQLCTVKL